MEYTIVHPQLCVDDGDRFIHDYVKPGVTYIIGACDPKMQRKMFKDAFAEAGGSYDQQVVPLDLRNMSTADTMKKVKETVEKVNAQQAN